MFSQLVIATGNKGKLREIEHMLAPLNIKVIPQSHFNVPECPEPHCTFIENALAKARHASKLTGLPALADDSGLCVDALQGAPGVRSARYADEADANNINANHSSDNSQDARNNQKLLSVLGAEKNRHAHFYCVMVLVRHEHDPEPIIAEGQWVGEILSEYRGSDGFGYDPLFLDAKTGKTVAELPLAIKSRISHRGHAMAKLLQKLERLSDD